MIGDCIKNLQGQLTIYQWTIGKLLIFYHQKTQQSQIFIADIYTKSDCYALAEESLDANLGGKGKFWPPNSRVVK